MRLPVCQSIVINFISKYKSDDIKSAVTGANMVVVCLGTGQELESEGNDRSDLNLPGKQLNLLQDAENFGEKTLFI